MQLLQCPKCKQPLQHYPPECWRCPCHSYTSDRGIVDFVQDSVADSQPPGFDISCLVMTLNEERNIEQLVNEASRELASCEVSYEVLIVDGGSTDRTVELARAAGAHVIHQSLPGYAEALKQGIHASRGQWILTLDGDLSHPTSLIPNFVQKRQEQDIMVGSRWIKGGMFEGPVHRHILSRILNLVFQRALTLPVVDSSSGYRIYRHDILDPAKYQSLNFSILEEILVKAVTDGYSVTEKPLQYRARRAGSSHARLIAFAASYLKTLAHLWMIRNDSGASDYDSRAFDSPNLIQRWWQRQRHRNIMSLLGPFTKEGLILDVGCGSSRIIQSLPHAVALDISMPKLRFLQHTNPCRIRGSALNLPFQDTSFDCLIHSQLIEHLPLSDNSFSEMRRVLKPGGTLIIGTVDYSSFTWPLIEKIYGLVMPHAYKDEHITQFSKTSLLDSLNHHGFKPVDKRDIIGGEITIKALKE